MNANACRIALCLSVAFSVRDLQAAPLRPTTITWGGYSHNEQMIGAQAQWPFVQKYMDGFLMHGMYWNNKRDYLGIVPESQWAATLTALGAALQKNGKTANIETGLSENEHDFDPAIPEKRGSYAGALKDIAKFKEFARYGVVISKVRPDWFPLSAAAVYARHFQTASTTDLLAMVTGADTYWGAYPGLPPENANWREYTRLVTQAFPNMAFGFDQAPCNFPPVPPDPAMRRRVPWEGVGYGYVSKGITPLYSKAPVLVNGQPVPVTLDFADLMMSVALSSRAHGINFYGFEGDTPYQYVTNNLGRSGKDLVPLLLHIERLQHRYGFHSAKIINDSPKTWDNEGFTIDLGTPMEINRVSVLWGAQYAKRFTMDGSRDNVTWTTLKAQDDGMGGLSDVTFAHQTVRWVRVLGRERATKMGYAVGEAQVFGPADPLANLAQGKPVSVTSARSAAGAGKGGHAERLAPELVDGNPATFWQSDYVSDDDWDRNFHDRSLQFLETYQGAGGRADQYIAESWYHGPYTLFPETKTGTFSNLARDLIRRVRGIDDNAIPFHADLLVTPQGGSQVGGGVYQKTPGGAQAVTARASGAVSFQLEIRNNGVARNGGDCRATMLLRATETGGTGWTVRYVAGGQDVTTQMLASGENDGWFAGGLEPGESKTVTVEMIPVPGAAHGSSRTASFALYWNPQDPALLVRDAVSVRAVLP